MTHLRLDRFVIHHPQHAPIEPILQDILERIITIILLDSGSEVLTMQAAKRLVFIPNHPPHLFGSCSIYLHQENTNMGQQKHVFRYILEESEEPLKTKATLLFGQRVLATATAYSSHQAQENAAFLFVSRGGIQEIKSSWASTNNLYSTLPENNLGPKFNYRTPLVRFFKVSYDVLDTMHKHLPLPAAYKLVDGVNRKHDRFLCIFLFEKSLVASFIGESQAKASSGLIKRLGHMVMSDISYGDMHTQDEALNKPEVQAALQAHVPRVGQPSLWIAQN